MEIQNSTIEVTPERVGNYPSAMLYFYNDLCAPCVALKPRIHHLVTTHFPKIDQFYYHAPEHPRLCAAHTVFSSPVFIFFFEGKEVFRGNNYVSLNEIQQRIGRLYRIMFE
ncbi:MAG: thioredoxin family protein [Bacteroidales bacterium]|nr:thioredoxin family protein [Bacteroidales bacterium]MDD3960333.1 thioredoxin family protein [Bacteroidales bacterium]